MTTGPATADNAADCSMHMTDREFAQLRQLIRRRIGINLTVQKRSLLENRQRAIVRDLGFTTFSQYSDYPSQDQTGQALDALANHITTNYTCFYREQAQFEFLTSIALPDVITCLRQRNSRDLRIWCAACSTGEEAYTLAMLILGFFGPEYHLWDAELLATNISRNVLDKAREALYSSQQLSHKPPALKLRYFTKLPNGPFAVCSEVKKVITFQRFNQINTEFPFKRPVHVVSCRNVMIYLDQPIGRALVQRLCQVTEPCEYLFLSHTETLECRDTSYRRVSPSIY